jgi:diadenosine tetraphosphate (Ap4A) HIT family hydrolase
MSMPTSEGSRRPHPNPPPQAGEEGTRASGRVGAAAQPRAPDTGSAGCVFCTIPEARIAAANPLAFALFDIAPVTRLHMLALPRRHVAFWFDLAADEKAAIDALLIECRRDILARDPAVRGFNIAVNVGEAAGQTILHCHVHLVPRRIGDGAGVVLNGRAKRLLAAD